MGCGTSVVLQENLEEPVFQAVSIDDDSVIRQIARSRPEGTLASVRSSSTLQSPIDAAAERGASRAVEALVSEGRVDVNHVDALHRRTPLIAAAAHGHSYTCHVLLEMGADPWKRDERGRTALHWTCASGAHEAVEEILSRMKSEDDHLRAEDGFSSQSLLRDEDRHDSASVLHRSSPSVSRLSFRDLETGEYQPSSSLDSRERSLRETNARSRSVRVYIDLATVSDGETPLHEACLHGHAECVRVLLRHGATVEPVTRKTCTTPLFLAVEHGHVSCAAALLRGFPSSDVHQSEEKEEERFREDSISPAQTKMVSRNVLLDTFHSLKHTPSSSHYQSLREASSLTEILRGFDCDHNVSLHHFPRRKKFRCPPYAADPQRVSSPDGYNAISRAVERGDLEMVETLLGPPLHHANLNRQLREVEEDALSFLDDSESRQHYPLGPQCSFANPNSLFLGHASSSGPYDSDDRLIHVALKLRYVAVAQALVDSGCNPNAVTCRGETPLTLITLRSDLHRSQELESYEHLVISLLERGADPNFHTPLLSAIHNSLESIAVRLVHAGADPDLECDPLLERTALMSAAAAGFDKLVEELLSSGADTEKVDGEGRSAMDLAIEANHSSVVMVLASKSHRSGRIRKDIRGKLKEKKELESTRVWVDSENFDSTQSTSRHPDELFTANGYTLPDYHQSLNNDSPLVPEEHSDRWGLADLEVQEVLQRGKPLISISNSSPGQLHSSHFDSLPPVALNRFPSGEVKEGHEIQSTRNATNSHQHELLINTPHRRSSVVRFADEIENISPEDNYMHTDSILRRSS